MFPCQQMLWRTTQTKSVKHFSLSCQKKCQIFNVIKSNKYEPKQDLNGLRLNLNSLFWQKY